jgi:DNA-binding transcriptional MerR regulator
MHSDGFATRLGPIFAAFLLLRRQYTRDTSVRPTSLSNGNRWRSAVAQRKPLTPELVPGSILQEAMSESGASKPMRSGELARMCGISTDTLRHYERVGVLPRPRRSPGGYRQYPPEALKRVQLVRRALEIGFTLDELAQILRVRDSGGAPCREVRALADSKLQQVKVKIDDLCALRDHMGRILADWDQRLTRTPQGARAGLLEALLNLPSRKGNIQ